MHNDTELAAMGSVFDALNALDPAQRQRVIRWTSDRFANAAAPKAKAGPKPRHPVDLRPAAGE
jgi:hypothetical protein